MKTLRKTLSTLWTTGVLYAYAVMPAFAAGTSGQVLGEGEPGGAIDISGGSIPGSQLADLTVGQLISTFIRVLLIAAAVVFFFWLVLGGIKWIMSGGDKARVESARDQVTHALIGLVIVFSAFAIAQLIKVLFDVNLFDLQIELAPAPTP